MRSSITKSAVVTGLLIFLFLLSACGGGKRSPTGILTPTLEGNGHKGLPLEAIPANTADILEKLEAFESAGDDAGLEKELDAVNADALASPRLALSVSGVEVSLPGMIEEIIDSARGLPENAFKNPGSKSVFYGRLRVVKISIQWGKSLLAQKLLEKTIMKATDGCAGGDPLEDLLTDCAAQGMIRPLVVTLISALKGESALPAENILTGLDAARDISNGLPTVVNIPGRDSQNGSTDASKSAPVFAGAGSRAELIGLINQLQNLVSKGDYRSAVDFLEKNLIPRLDGCGQGNINDDLVIECSAQERIYQELTDTLWSLDGQRVLARQGATIEVPFSEAGLNIPAGALNSDTVINVIPVYYSDLPKGHPQGYYYEKAVKFQPHGLVFNTPVEAEFPLQTARKPGETFTVFYYDESFGAWVDTGIAAVVGPDGNSASAMISHFSYYLLGSGVDPNAKKIVFEAWDGSTSDILVREFPSGEVHNLTAELGSSEYGPSINRQTVSFYSNYHSRGTRIFVMNLDGTGLTPISADTGWDSNPDISADGSMVTFIASGRPGMEQPQIFVSAKSPDGSWRESQLTSGRLPNLNPQFSYEAENPKIIFERSDTVWIMNGAGDGQEPLGIRGCNPAFAPDGKRIAYTRYYLGTNKIFVYDLESQTETMIDSDSNSNYEPTFSAEGTKVAFHSLKSALGRGQYEIWEADIATQSLGTAPLVPCQDLGGAGMDCFAPQWEKFPVSSSVKLESIQICDERQFNPGAEPACDPENIELIYSESANLKAVCVYDNGSSADCTGGVQWETADAAVGEARKTAGGAVFLTDVAARGGTYPAIGQAGSTAVTASMQSISSQQLQVTVSYGRITGLKTVVTSSPVQPDGEVDYSGVTGSTINYCPVLIAARARHPNGVNDVRFFAYFDGGYHYANVDYTGTELENGLMEFTGSWDCSEAVANPQTVKIRIDVYPSADKPRPEEDEQVSIILSRTPAGTITSPTNPPTTGLTRCPQQIQAAVNHPGGADYVTFFAWYDSGWHYIGRDLSAPYSAVWDCGDASDQTGVKFRIDVYVTGIGVAQEADIQGDFNLNKNPAGVVTYPTNSQTAEITYCPQEVQAVVNHPNGADYVTFYAWYDSSWHYIGRDYSAPYSAAWDCGEVSDQDGVKFGIDVYVTGIGLTQKADIEGDFSLNKTRAGTITSPENNSTAEIYCPQQVLASVDNPNGADYVTFYAWYDLSWHYIGRDYSAPYSASWDCSEVSDQSGVKFRIDVYVTGIGLTQKSDIEGDFSLMPTGRIIAPLDSATISSCPARIGVEVSRSETIENIMIEVYHDGLWENIGNLDLKTFEKFWDCGKVPDQDGIKIRALATIAGPDGGSSVVKLFDTKTDIRLSRTAK